MYNEEKTKVLYMADDKFAKFDRVREFGRPKKGESEKKTKKVLLSMTEKQYEKFKKYQEIFHKNTLTATLEYLIEEGEKKIMGELEMFRS